MALSTPLKAIRTVILLTENGDEKEDGRLFVFATGCVCVCACLRARVREGNKREVARSNVGRE